MKRYFEKMTPLGKEITEYEIGLMEENFHQIKGVEKEIAQAAEKVKQTGLPVETIHSRGEKTVYERIELLVDDESSFFPLNTLYDPEGNEEGTTGVVTGIGKIAGRCAVIVASNNQILAGAWLPGHAEKIFRAQDISEQLRIPLVWLLECSGIKLTQQEKLYAGRRSGGRIFFRNAELTLKGIPVLAGVFGTNTAGGGYHAISSATIFAHKNANMAVGGAGIVSGMNPKGEFDLEGAEQISEATRKSREAVPGSVSVHYEHTGFFKNVFETEEEVINALRDSIKMMSVYEPDLLRVAEPKGPFFPPYELNYIIPFNQKRVYNIEQVLARLFDNSEHTEYRSDYGPEVYCGLAKLDGFLTGVVANRQGFLPAGYPEYTDSPGIGGKLYRQGLIKMSEFVTLCGRDKIPMVWLQDTTGIDVGDQAEKAELLALGQALIYSIEDSDIPMATVVLRKGSAASHYIMGGPQANRNNVFTLGTPTAEIYVMHSETAAVATFARRLVREKDAGRPLDGIIENMNKLVEQYYGYSRPPYCARVGFVDEIVSFHRLREYLVFFIQAAYQNPRSTCPSHQMLLPRIIKG